MSTQEALPKRALSQGAILRHPAITQYRPTIEVYCLGTFQVHVGGKRIEYWRSIRAKSLLKYLIAQQARPLPKDILMEALWPSCEPSVANNNLRAAVHSLRQTLSLAGGTDDNFAWMLFQDGNYQINPEAALWVDAEHFENHWSVGRQLERDGKIVEAIREYETAEALYVGDYLEDDLYEEWTFMRREALKDTYLTMLGKLADYSMQAGDYEGCIAYCQRILLREACREDAYQRLMRCYNRLGRRDRAIVWYRLYERTVRKELDVEPLHAMVTLYHKLLKDELI